MTKQLHSSDQLSEFLLYTTPAWAIKVEVFFHDENIWLTQERMSQLFGVKIPAISKHLKNIFESWELEEYSVISKMETTAQDWKNYIVNYYNLDAITGKTAAEIIHEKADHATPHMGLTLRKSSPWWKTLLRASSNS
jgi:hypothetical protein